jgi:hypothetical protein
MEPCATTLVIGIALPFVTTHQLGFSQDMTFDGRQQLLLGCPRFKIRRRV